MNLVVISGTMTTAPPHLPQLQPFQKHLRRNASSTHWLRFKNVLETDNGSAQFMHDYFEIVPLSYLRNPDVTEEEKRN